MVLMKELIRQDCWGMRYKKRWGNTAIELHCLNHIVHCTYTGCWKYYRTKCVLILKIVAQSEQFPPVC